MSELIFIGIAHAIFTIIFIVSKKERPLSDNILVFWIIFLAMPLVTRATSPALLDIAIPLLDKKLAYPLCLGPFLWLYVKCVTGDLDKIKISYSIHFMPFILVTLFQVMFREAPINAEFKRGNQLFSQLIWLTNITSLFCYSAVVVWRLQKHSKQVLNSFSSLTTQITLRWLTWLTCGFIVAYTLPLFARFASLPLPFQSHGYALTGFIFILSFFGLKQTQVFTRDKANIFEAPENIRILGDDNKSLTQNKNDLTEIENEKNSDSEQSIEATNKSKENKQKYQRSGLTQERALQYLKRLEEYTQTEKPYLDANLTVDKLANQSHIPRHYLTQILNEQLNKNFYLYINEYRIKQVKQRLNESSNHNMTILDIAYECGFNSKSTFNTIFKKITKMTPSQYKKSIQQ